MNHQPTESNDWKSKTAALGIDLGGTKLAAGLVLNNQLLNEPQHISTPSGADSIIEAIINFIEDCRKQHLIIGVGIATAGIVHPHSGQILGSTGNIPGWKGTPLKKILESRTLLPVHVENDANAAAYGECQAEGLEGKTCVVMLTLGTGIGSGIVLNGQLYRGSNYTGGECGHIRISLDNQRLCTCGLWDCWEAYASGRGLLTTTERLLADTGTQNSQLGLKGKSLNTKDILEAATSGDLLAKQAIACWHQHICAGMISLAHTLNPDVFIIGGGLSRFVDFELLRELLCDHTFPRIAETLDIRPAVLGNAAGMIGAADLLLDNMSPSKHSPVLN